jgi:glycosyltransferase involved in cell wall biosynthesis
VLAGLPDDALVAVDGLVASAVPEVLAPQAKRLRLVVLMHMPLGDLGDGAVRLREAEALSSAVAVVTTSRWSRRRLLALYDLPGDRVHVATPGVDPAPLVSGRQAGTRLLCVAAVTHHKGHDVLARALARLAEAPWDCVCAGTLDREPSFVDSLRRFVGARGLADRFTFGGVHPSPSLQDLYARTDLLVLPSRGEPYGMVVTEALARGIPVLGTDAKGLPEALGRAPDGTRPGLLVPPDDPVALADALRAWLGDQRLRSRLRSSARDRRKALRPWARTAETFAAVLDRAPVHSGVSR